jgi:putative addiction module component (TIGR02574 family)
MDKSRESLLAAAIALPESERVEFVERMLETLSPAMNEVSDEALAAELERRAADVANGTAGLIPWSALRSEE